MNTCITYKVICRFEFYLNDKILNSIYIPMIGYDAVALYRFLYTEISIDHAMGLTYKKESEIVEKLQWDYPKYIKNRNILEAVGLLSTYLDPQKQEHLIFFIKQVPSWEEFKNNSQLIALFKNNTDALAYDRVRYLFEGNDKIFSYHDISCSFEACFGSDSFNHIATFDFQLLYDTVFKIYHKLITISTSAKAMIETYFKTYELSFKEILNIVLQSIYRDEDGIYVEEKILKNNLEKMVNTAKAVNINHIININRNHKIFMSEITDDTYEYILSDYKTIRAEQYLSSISKATPSQLQLNLINLLRNQYHLPDFVINVLMDYSIFKNAGRIEPNYIQKIAISINRLNIQNIEQLIQHLRNSHMTVHKGDHQ